MRLRFSLVFLIALAVGSLRAEGPTNTPSVGPSGAVVSHAPRDPVFQARLPDFTEKSYDREVEALFEAFEKQIGRKIVPGPKKRVGLKVYADSGPGMATPVALTEAVIAALERRGYEHQNIFLVGLNALRLRMTGYLPSLVSGETPFNGNPVYVLESGRYYDPVWFYDSPLPQRFDPVFAAKQTQDASNTSTKDEDRKSFLATPLFLDSDFWINMPVFTDHPTLGVNGALVNATLWNASNTARFFRSPANAPAAVAEMSAIPELRETWLFTIASLEHYQFIGGPFFNSLYTVSEPVIWLSRDPVMMDALMRDRMNEHRRQSGFEPIDEDIRTLEFAETLGVGSTKTSQAKIIRVGN
ncbi:MAG TPA: DUF362 domain-containing protein [Opitutaceae bacterium]|nr:DUF362 domain-containing protein [Opitutaceae bacterium]